MDKNENKDNQELNTNLIENKVCMAVGRLLITPYNWSLLIATVMIWSLGGSIFMYSANANFDMAVLVNEYTRNFSMLAIAIGFFFSTKRSYILIGLGIGNYLLCFSALMMSKTLFAQGMIGELLFKPLSIFCFLLLLKNMCILAIDRELNNLVK